MLWVQTQQKTRERWGTLVIVNIIFTITKAIYSGKIDTPLRLIEANLIQSWTNKCHKSDCAEVGHKISYHLSLWILKLATNTSVDLLLSLPKNQQVRGSINPNTVSVWLQWRIEEDDTAKAGTEISFPFASAAFFSVWVWELHCCNKPHFYLDEVPLLFASLLISISIVTYHSQCSNRSTATRSHGTTSTTIRSALE